MKTSTFKFLDRNGLFADLLIQKSEHQRLTGKSAVYVPLADITPSKLRKDDNDSENANEMARMANVNSNVNLRDELRQIPEAPMADGDNGEKIESLQERDGEDEDGDDEGQA